MSFKVGGLSVGVSLGSLALILSSPANALGSPSGATRGGSDVASDVGETEIVVTAQRREERLVDIPIAVSVVSGSDFKKTGSVNLADLTKFSAGVVINGNGGHVQPTIRGIGTNLANVGADSPIAIYINGVYQPSLYGSGMDLPDIESIEILKGPQGTLYGRNATGGAILIKTREPSFNNAGNFQLLYGRYNEVRAEGYVTSGLSDTVAFSLTGAYRREDGWVHDLRNGAQRNEQHGADARARLLWQASSAARVILSASYDEISNPTALAYILINGNTQGNTVPNSGPVAVERGQVSTNTPLVGRDRIFATSIDASLELGWATLRSLTNYHHEKQRFINDLDSSYANILSSNYHQIYEDVSEQLTLTSQRNKNLNWVLGAEYFHGHATDPDFLVNTSVPGVPALSRIGTDALAAYADGTLRLGRFALIAGARYSAERKSDLYQPSTAPKPLIDAHKWFKDFTPRLGGRFAITPQSNIYFTWTKGFKSGNYNGSSSNSIPVRPEKVVAFEGGYKLASSVVRLATSAFYYKYKDIQTSAYDYTTGTSRLINAARAKIYGAEAELNVKVTSELDLRANIAYTHARYQAFPGAIVNVPKPGGTTGNVTKIIDASGNTMIRSPTITISGGANYRKDIEHGYVEASVNAYYSSEVYYTFDNRLKQNPYATVDGSVTWHPDEHFRIGVWGRNLSNANYATFQTATSSRDAAIPAKPRSFGVLAGYRF